MMNTNDKEALISEMRKCASILTEMAADESLLLNKTASASAPVATSRSEWTAGFMSGLGLDN